MSIGKYLSEQHATQLFARLPELESTSPVWAYRCFVVRFVMGTGVRVSEMLPLRVGQTAKRNGEIIIWLSKRKRSRLVICSPELMPHYRKWVEAKQDGELLFGRISARCVGKDRMNEPVTRRYLAKCWDQVLEACGLPHYNIHCGRHTWATWELASHRLTEKEVQAQLGHKKVEMTLNTYAHAPVLKMYEADKRPEYWAIAKGV